MRNSVSHQLSPVNIRSVEGTSYDVLSESTIYFARLNYDSGKNRGQLEILQGKHVSIPIVVCRLTPGSTTLGAHERNAREKEKQRGRGGGGKR